MTITTRLISSILISSHILSQRSPLVYPKLWRSWKAQKAKRFMYSEFPIVAVFP